MSWRAIETTDVLGELTAAEASKLQAASGDETKLAEILSRTVAAVRGSISASGYRLDAAGTIPDQLRLDVVAIARWRWLISFPALASLQTDARKADHERAQDRLDQIARGEFPIEAPAAASAGEAAGLRPSIAERDLNFQKADQEGI